MKKVGKITLEIGATPDKDEIATVSFLAEEFGDDVVFLKAIEAKGVHTPDILWHDKKWEIKNPRANGKFTIEHAVQDASKQSENIVIDLRNSKMPEAKAITKIEREFGFRTKIKRILIIKKSRKTLDLER